MPRRAAGASRALTLVLIRANQTGCGVTRAWPVGCGERPMALPRAGATED